MGYNLQLKAKINSEIVKLLLAIYFLTSIRKVIETVNSLKFLICIPTQLAKVI